MTTSPSPDTRGHYVIMDNSDKTVKVVANTLPAPSKKFQVKGIVQVEPTTQQPFLREVSRQEVGQTTGSSGSGFMESLSNMNPVVLVLVALIILTVIALIVVILRKPMGQQTVQIKRTVPVDSGPGVDETVFTPEETRMVTKEEVERSVGGLKTRQVPSPLAEIRILGGKLSGKAFPLAYETSIGRIHGDIALEDPSVSRQHAMIHFKEDHYILENRSEVNPVIINGERVKKQKQLKDGDELVLGVIKLQFKFV